MRIFKERIDFWRFIQNIDCDIYVTKNKEIYDKNGLIAMFKPDYKEDNKTI